MSGIQMMLLGTGGAEPVINFNNVVVYSGQYGVAAEAGYQISSNGKDYENVNETYTEIQQWIDPTSAAVNYEVFVTIDSGTLSIGSAATGTWVGVGSSPEWVRLQGPIGLSQVEMTFEIRKVGTTNIIHTWAVTLIAERFS